MATRNVTVSLEEDVALWARLEAARRDTPRVPAAGRSPEGEDGPREPVRPGDVTLEPCSHFGRTGPCTKSIIESGIKRVVVAVKDPNPKVNGKGIRELVKSGIKVDTGLFEEEAKAINEDFFKFIRKKVPYVALKAALTLNGLIAADSGDSKWITSFEARKKVHELRNVFDAVLVGMNTVIADDPKLDARYVKGRPPVRIVLSSGRDLPIKSYLARTSSSIRTILLTSKEIIHPACKYVEYIEVPGSGKDLKIGKILEILGAKGIKSILVEGGSQIFTSFIEQKGVDIFYIFQSLKILSSGIPFIKGKKTSLVKEALLLKQVELKRIGHDILITAKSGN